MDIGANMASIVGCHEKVLIFRWSVQRVPGRPAAVRRETRAPWALVSPIPGKENVSL